MPGKDGTGPMGNGPIGRGRGPCGRGQGRGQGQGRGMGRGMGGGNRFGQDAGAGKVWGQQYPGSEPVADRAALEDQISMLENELQAAKQQLKALEPPAKE